FYQRADVTGDGRDELIAQPARAGDEAYVLFATGADSWEGVWQRLNDIDPRLAWDSESATLIVGDFNGDGRDDLLWRRSADASPRADEPAVAMLLANMQGEFDEVSHQWDEDFLGAEWDPATHRIELRDITGDGIADIILMARSASGTHYLVPGRLDGKL